MSVKLKSADQLPELREKFEAIWKKIKAEFPRLAGNLNFAFHGEFVPLKASVVEMLKTNHYVFFESQWKDEARALVKASKDTTDHDLKKLLPKLQLNPDCRIEPIWSDFEYDEIYRLQKHPMVDQGLTPQTKASIRIVIGTIGTADFD